MLESRRSYGWGSSVGKTEKASLKKWQVFYRTKSGGFGEIGYKLFNTKEQAIAFGEELKRKDDYITEIIVRRPCSTYSNY